MIPYDNSNFSEYLLGLNPDDILDKFLYESLVDDTEVHQKLKDFDLYQIDRYLLLRELNVNSE